MIYVSAEAWALPRKDRQRIEFVVHNVGRFVLELDRIESSLDG